MNAFGDYEEDEMTVDEFDAMWAEGEPVDLIRSQIGVLSATEVARLVEIRSGANSVRTQVAAVEIRSGANFVRTQVSAVDWTKPLAAGLQRMTVLVEQAA